jgi:hypothetical protein
MNEIILAPCDVINKTKQNYNVKKVIFEKIEFFIKNKKVLKVLKLKFYYAKWTLQIEVVNGNLIYYCNFRVYLVTGPIEGR